MSKRDKGHDSNPDPITGAPGSHPLGTAAGSAGAGAAGAAIGAAVGGPVGAIVGGAIGAVAGGAAGHGAAESVNPTVEDAYWRENFHKRPYTRREHGYDHYRPAYQYGWESRARHGNRTWDEVETDLGRGWENVKGKSKLTWNEAKMAAHDAWHRIGVYDSNRASNANLSGTSPRRDDSRRGPL